MLRDIIYREFLANMVTARFSLGFIICIALVGANTYVLTRSYKDGLQSYQQAVQAHTDEIRNINVYGRTCRWPDAIARHRLFDMWVNQYQHEVDDFVEKHDLDKSFNGSSSSSSTIWRTQTGKYDGPPEKLQLYHDYLRFSGELRITYADKQGQMWQEYLSQNPIRQAKLALNIARISPAAAYTNAAAILAETDLDSHLRFLDQASQYRHELIQFLRNEDAFASETWYNPDAEKKVVTEAIPRFREQ